MREPVTTIVLSPAVISSPVAFSATPAPPPVAWVCACASTARIRAPTAALASAHLRNRLGP
ncbi:hypothetical protein ACR720_16290 [Sphingomonas parapaucimobilis]|uniref:hypothetical protein n=1 Tax=Sphingomonas parapaucimobilis TaxID=28213 RepID=UPI0039EB291B